MRLTACVCFLGVLGAVIAERSALQGFRALQNTTDAGSSSAVPPPAAATPPAPSATELTPVEQEFVDECGQQIQGCGAAPECKACVTNAVQVSVIYLLIQLISKRLSDCTRQSCEVLCCSQSQQARAAYTIAH
jgi:hypothetical protein